MKIFKAMLLASLLATSVSAIAHTGLKSSLPADEQTLETTPEKLTLTFSGSVRLMKVTLTDSDDKALEIDFKPSAKANKIFDINSPELSSGEYTVNWISMGKDGHKIKGDFSFNIQNKALEHTEKVADKKDEHNNH